MDTGSRQGDQLQGIKTHGTFQEAVEASSDESSPQRVLVPSCGHSNPPGA